MKVRLVGWNSAFLLVPAVKVLREWCQLGLADAKDVFDRLLNGEAPIVYVRPERDVQKFVLEMAKLDVEAIVVSQQD